RPHADGRQVPWHGHDRAPTQDAGMFSPLDEGPEQRSGGVVVLDLGHGHGAPGRALLGPPEYRAAVRWVREEHRRQRHGALRDATHPRRWGTEVDPRTVVRPAGRDDGVACERFDAWGVESAEPDRYCGVAILRAVVHCPGNPTS